MNRRTGHDGLSAGKGAETERNCSGIAGNDRDEPRVKPELLGADLCERGLEALPDRDCAGKDRNLAGPVDADGRRFEGAAARALQTHAHADPKQAALRARAPLTFRESGIVNRFKAGRHRLRIIAAVVHDRRSGAGRKPRVVGHLVRRNEIAAAHLGAIELELVGDAVERTLHREIG